MTGQPWPVLLFFRSMVHHGAMRTGALILVFLFACCATLKDDCRRLASSGDNVVDDWVFAMGVEFGPPSAVLARRVAGRLKDQCSTDFKFPLSSVAHDAATRDGGKFVIGDEGSLAHRLNHHMLEELGFSDTSHHAAGVEKFWPLLFRVEECISKDAPPNCAKYRRP